MKTITRQNALMAVGLLMVLNLSGCAKAPAGNDLTMTLQFGSYATAQDKPLLWRLFGPNQAHAAVSSLKMCFKRLRFKAADQDTTSPATDSSNKDFAIGEILVSTNGASLGSIQVPAGNYQRIEFDLDSHCASGKSIQLTNANGTFTSTQTITVKFRGNFTAISDGTLTLGVQSILDALNSYNGTDLKVATEAASGVLTN